MSPAPALCLRDVRKEYDPHVILRGVTADIFPGVTLLTGANGAGKSTLLRLIAGLERPTSGDIQRADDTPPAYVGHATCLYGGLSALENLRFWDRLYGGDGQDARLFETLERVNLLSRAEDHAGTFSRGMAQRLNLARVLLRPACVWLLDEPDTGLDTAAADLLLREIRAARDRGLVVIWITHHVQVHRPLADCILHLENGRLAATPDSPSVPGQESAC